MLIRDQLFAFEAVTEGSKKFKNLSYVREVSEEERRSSEESGVYLFAMTAGSHLAHLISATQDLHEEIEALETKGPTPNNIHQSGSRIQREFKAWLSAFKSFDDRTSVWLSRTVGTEDPAYLSFKRLLSEEFDANFAYRLCCALRNAAEHAGDVINDMRYTTRGNKGTGETEHEILLRFDGPKLAHQFPKMRSATRAELQTITEPLELEWIVGDTLLSCERIQAGLFLAMWDRTEQAIKIIEGFHREALNHGGEWAMFVPTSSTEELRAELANLVEQPRVHIEMRHNPKNLADLARENYKQASTIRRTSTNLLSWSDFTPA